MAITFNPRSRRWVWIGTLVYLLVLCKLSDTVFLGLPLTYDEHQYRAQAHLFNEGRLTFERQGLPTSLLPAHTVYSSNTYTSKYPPGTSLLLSLGILFGGIQYINPLLTTLTLLLLHFLFKRLFRHSIANWGTLLVGSAPYFWSYSGSFMSQSASLFASTLTMYFLLCTLPIRLPNSGLFLSHFFATIVRPFDACLMATSTCYLLLMRRKTALGISVVAGIVVASLVLSALNYSAIGYAKPVLYAFVFPVFGLFQGEFSPVGFFWWYIDGLQYRTWPNIYLWTFVYAGVVFPLLACLGFLVRKRALDQTVRRYLVFTFVSILFGYSLTPFLGWPLYGARYLYSAVGVVSIFYVAAISWISAYCRLRRWTKAFTVFLVLMFAWNIYTSVSKGNEFRLRALSAESLLKSFYAACPDKSIAYINLGPALDRYFLHNQLFHPLVYADGRNPFPTYSGKKRILTTVASQKDIANLPEHLSSYTRCIPDSLATSHVMNWLKRIESSPFFVGYEGEERRYPPKRSASAPLANSVPR